MKSYRKTPIDERNRLLEFYDPLDLFLEGVFGDLEKGHALWLLDARPMNPKTVASALTPNELARLAKAIADSKAQNDAVLHAKLVGPYIRVFRLWSGPVRKLADWRQLPLGNSMMLAPEAIEKEEELALVRSRYLRRIGAGEFEVSRDDNKAIWVTRTGFPAGVSHST